MHSPRCTKPAVQEVVVGGCGVVSTEGGSWTVDVGTAADGALPAMRRIMMEMDHPP